MDGHETVEDDVDPRCRPKQTHRVGVGRSGIEVSGGGVLDDLAGVHHGDAVAYPGDDPESWVINSTATPRRRWRSASRSRIWAWIVTSRASSVVGDEQLGFAR